MKSYMEEKTGETFNWYEELKKENPDWETLKKKAGDWVTCACGNQCSIIPRNECGCPHDDVLEHLGGSEGFYGAVVDEDAEEAIHLLDMIEQRSAFLIKTIQKELEEYCKTH